MDKDGDDETRADGQRGEDLGEGRTNGRFDFWDSSDRIAPEERQEVSRRKSSEKSVKRMKTKIDDVLGPGNVSPGQRWRQAEQFAARLVGLFLLWNTQPGIQGH